MSTPARYHAGELGAHARAGLVEKADIARRAIRSELPPAAAGFLAEQPMIVLGAADRGGRMWATLLTGPAGFVQARGDRVVEVASRPAPGDPLAGVLDRPAKVGMIAIEPAARRRMRVNGRCEPTDAGLRVVADQVFANCPKYIQERSPRAAPDHPVPPPAVRTRRLSAEQQELVAGSDTFFVATRSADSDADASHRGGSPGFVQVLDSTSLRWPDYVGNAMMMTLGNLLQDDAAGLLFIDWRTGTTLQLTGTARVDWSPAAAAHFPGAQRVVDFRLSRSVQVERASPLSWTAPSYSRFNPPAPPSGAPSLGTPAGS